ncbi:sensor histidine kinase [Algirhabdus cladophorae]|uniref:sensor histidine kinase n=1 Tax=Algirhabdus cladophorae TaxID=3377108 RepID=UPI003B849F64
MFNTLSGRFLILTIIFVMIAEVLIFVPSIARFREDYLLARLERAQIASLVLLAEDMIDESLEAELLKNADVFNVVLRRDEVRQLILAADMPTPIYDTYDLREPAATELIGDAIMRLWDTTPRTIRVIGDPVKEAGLLIEVTLSTEKLREAMIGYGLNILRLSAIISIFTAVLLFIAVQRLFVRPVRQLGANMQRYAAAPEDARNIVLPASSITELRESEEALNSLQTQLTGALKQKDRLAQLGQAVSKISHDLRNILTSAQLFTDRIEASEDPGVKRMAPKLVNSITRAVNLCEGTLKFGKAEEAAPNIEEILLNAIIEDVVESERLSVGEYDLSFAEDIPTGTIVKADAEQLYRVVSNLVRNARQAIIGTGKPGEIAISATSENGDMIIEISDTGPGLPPKAREHLFAPFQGGVRKGGTGLGLAIAQELIRGHGGSIGLAKSDETGTTFSICLPQDVPQQHETAS